VVVYLFADIFIDTKKKQVEEHIFATCSIDLKSSKVTRITF